MFRHHIEERF